MPMNQMEPFSQRVVGKIVWNGKRGIGSYLTFEFGDPHLNVRDPVPSSSESGAVKNILRRRRVWLVGDWHLWIRDARWSIECDGQTADSSDSSANVDDMLKKIDGQIVESFSLLSEIGMVEIKFDLGGLIRVRPEEPGRALDPEEQSVFQLHEYSGRIMVFNGRRILQIQNIGTQAAS